MDLEQLVRYVGILVSIVGALVVSPSVTARAVGDFGAWVSSRTLRLARYLGLAGPPSVHRGSGVSGLSRMTGTAFGYAPVAFAEDATVDAKVEHLRERLSDLAATMSCAQAEAQRRNGEQERAIAAVRDEVQSALGDLASRLTAAERSATTAAGRALPVVGVGVVLSGASPELGSRTLPAGLLMAGASLYAAWAAGASVAAQRAAGGTATR